MHPVKKILVAIKDIDAKSMPAVRKAAQLAKANGATLELFHALSDTVLVEALDARRISLKDYEAQRLGLVLKRLQVIAKGLRKHDIEVTCAAEWDYPPAEAIVRRALRTAADLIVAERHASRHVAGWMLAYTDWELLRQAPCPVLLVKVSKPYHRPVVLTAIDPFHEHAKPARLDALLLQASGMLATSLKGSLRIVHCVPPSTLVTASWTASPVVVDVGRNTAVLQRARKALAAEVAHHPLPSHQLAVLEGSAREAIPQAARAAKASIVVMGALSRSGLRRLLVGNTAEAVLDALTCDVLVVKPGRFQTKVPRRGRGAQLMALPSAMTG
ncbi:MAG: universal stress protein [Gammaproteobacteria bacterium]|nr:universal stress protein [Gammaproteobacteria bacterium]